MLNRFPLWKYLLILAVLAIAFIYSASNLYPDDPATQVTGASTSQEIGEADRERISKAHVDGGAAVKSASLDEKGRGGYVRLERPDDTYTEKAVLRREHGDAYVCPHNTPHCTPGWERQHGAS